MNYTHKWVDDYDNHDNTRAPIVYDLGDSGKTNTMAVSPEKETVTLNNVPVYTEAGIEISYAPNETAITCDKYDAAVSGSVKDGYAITLTYQADTYPRENVSFPVHVNWVDDDNHDRTRPESLTVTVSGKANNTDLTDTEYSATITLTENDGWGKSGDSSIKLPKNYNGQAIDYTVAITGGLTDTTSELAYYSGSRTLSKGTNAIYETTLTNAAERFDATVTFAFEGEYEYTDGGSQYLNRPANVDIDLGTVKHEDVSVTDGEAVVTDSLFALEYDGVSGQMVEVTYTITPANVTGYYTTPAAATVSKTNPTAKLTYNALWNTYSVKLEWNDADNQDGIRPESGTANVTFAESPVSVTLSKLGTEIAAALRLPAYINADVAIGDYSLSTNVTGYTAELVAPTEVGAPYIVKLTHATETTSVNGSISWDDSKDQDGMRPEAVDVYLLADGEKIVASGSGEGEEEYKKVTVTKDNWTFSFTDLPKKAAGKDIVYSVAVDGITGYESNSEKAENGSIVVTLTHVPEVIDITVPVKWNDNDDQDGKRKTVESVVVQLMAGSKVADEITAILEADNNNPSATFADVPVYSSGEKITYSVAAGTLTQSGDYYSAAVDDGKIVLTHQPMTFTLEVKAAFAGDEETKDTTRKAVTVTGAGTDLTLDNTNSWTQLVELPIFQNGKEIEYILSASEIDGYTRSSESVKITAQEGMADSQSAEFTYTINQYMITFDTVGGSAIAPITQNYGTKVTAPVDPTRTGYTFEGWDPEVPATMPAENVTVKAKWTPITYTIQYDGNGHTGGTAPANTTHTYDQAVTLASNSGSDPLVRNYTVTFNPKDGNLDSADSTATAQAAFNGWTATAELTDTTVLESGKVLNLSAENGATVTVYANWTLDSVTLPTPTREHYTFGGWYTDENCADGNKVDGETYTPSSDTTLYAKWTPGEYTIKYNLDGGTVTTENPTSYTIESEAITLTNPTKTGYTFDGWTGTDLDEKTETVTIQQGSTGNREYTANWTINQYTITFNANGGKIGDQEKVEITQNYNTAVTVPANPTRTGHTFVKWDKDIPATMPAENMTITALWNVNQYTISFDTQGGSLIDPIMKPYGEALQKPNDPTKAGYTFKGWNADFPATMPAGDMTLTAIWEANITYIINGVEDTTLTPKTYAEGTATMLATPQITGHTFEGWYKNENCSGDTVMEIEESETGPQTFYGKATKNRYRITWKDGFGNTLKTEEVEYGEVPPKYTDDLSKTGYTFTSWDTEIPGTMPANDVTITALWREHRYTVKFNANAGTGMMEEILLSYSEKKTLSENTFSRQHYTFEGWNTAANGNGRSIADKAEVEKLTAEDNGTVTLYAQWEPVEYKITYDLGDGKLEEGESNPEKYTIESEITLTNPTKTGYTFAGWTGTGLDKPTEAVTIPTGSTGIREYTATWTANTNTAYTVKHWKQKLGATSNEQNDTNYTLEAAEDTENLTGTTGVTVTPAVKTYPGFTAPTTQTVTIAADGSTVVDYYYTRNSYTFTLGSATGAMTTGSTATGSYKYGAAITLKAAADSGYTWEKWVSDNPELVTDLTNAEGEFTMPAGNITMTPVVSVNSYTLTFDLDGGNIDGDTDAVKITQDYGTDVTAPADPEKVGYTFAGWTPAVPSTMPAKNETYTAQWTANGYTVAFNGNGATSGTMVSQGFTYDAEQGLTANGFERKYTVTYNANKGTVAPDSADAEATFNGWATEATGEKVYGDQEVVENLSATPGATVNLYANWTLGKVTLPQPSRDGYTFAGWYTEATGGEKIGDAGAEYEPSENVTLYAKWTINQYTVTFDLAGGKIGDSAENIEYTLDYGSSVTVPADPTKAANAQYTYKFAGWTPAIATVTGNVTYTAQYTATTNTYTVTWKNENGDVLETDTEVPYGTTPTYNGETPEKAADAQYTYTFVGWDPEIANVTGNVTYTAQYTATPKTYTITFDLAGGKNGDSTANVVIPVAYGSTVNVTAPTNLTKEGHTFAGWDAEIPATMPAENVKITAKWTANGYTVAFNGNGATSGTMASQGFTYDVQQELTANAFTKTGHRFAGWNTEANGSGTSYEDKASVKNLAASGEVTLYAQWMINGYTITFDLAGGKIGNSTENVTITGNYGTSVTAPVPEKDGYTFAGWTEGESATIITAPTTMPAKNMTLKAQWTIITYTIAYNLDGGSLEEGKSNPVSYTVESEAITLVNPEKTGYTFAGWTGTGLTEATEEVTIAAESTGNREYTATWTPQTYAFKYELYGGTNNSENPVGEYGYDDPQSIIELKDPTPPEGKNWQFAGWYTAASFEESAKITEFDKKAYENPEDVPTLYARWQKSIDNVMALWDDQNNQDGLRQNVDIVLYRDYPDPENEGSKIFKATDMKFTLTPDQNDLGDDGVSFVGLDVHDENGVEIVYEVRVDVSHMKDKYDNIAYKIYHYEKGDEGQTEKENYFRLERVVYTKFFTVRIVWEDENNKWDTRPDKLRVKLVADGPFTQPPEPDVEQELSAGNGWMTEWYAQVNPTIETRVKPLNHDVEMVDMPSGKYVMTTQMNADNTEKIITFTIRDLLLPPTGDESSLLLWSGLLALCASALGYLGLKNKKRKA